MTTIEKITDIFLLVVSVLFTAWFMYETEVDKVIIYKEAYVLLFLDVGILFKIFKLGSLQLLVLLLLLIFLFGGVDLSYTVTKNQTSITYSSTTKSGIDIRVIVFIITSVYLLLIRKTIVRLVSLFKRKSDKEQREIAAIEFDYYYNKFKEYEDADLEKMKKEIEFYLPQAQKAIKRIASERS